MNTTTNYYVYVLFDHRAIPRYVGMGRGRRWTDHEHEKRPTNRQKAKFIRDALTVLGEVPKTKIRENLTREEAAKTEVALIAAIGRTDLGTGPLSNRSPGGDGGDFGEAIKRSKANWTPEKRAEIGSKARIKANQFWNSLSPEEQKLRSYKSSQASILKVKEIKAKNPKYDVNRAKKISTTKSKRTTEQKAETRQKILDARTPEERSQSTLDWYKNLTPEQRSAKANKAWATRRSKSP